MSRTKWLIYTSRTSWVTPHHLAGGAACFYSEDFFLGMLLRTKYIHTTNEITHENNTDSISHVTTSKSISHVSVKNEMTHLHITNFMSHTSSSCRRGGLRLEWLLLLGMKLRTKYLNATTETTHLHFTNFMSHTASSCRRGGSLWNEDLFGHVVDN